MKAQLNATYLADYRDGWMGLAPVHQLEMGDRRIVMCAGRYMLFFRWPLKAIPFRDETPTNLRALCPGRRLRLRFE